MKEGSLFCLENDRELRITEPSHIEYFWLCDPCSQAMTLRLGENGVVENVVLSTPKLAVDRREGWLLRSVNDPSSENGGYSRLRMPAGLYGA